MNQDRLKTYYTNIRSILAYASPVFYNFLSNTCKWRLDRLQASATKIIEPNLDYLERLKVLDLLTLSDCINTASESVFKKIARNEKHPLFNRIAVDQARVSSRLVTVYRPPKCRTQKHFNGFFPFYMSNFNKQTF